MIARRRRRTAAALLALACTLPQACRSGDEAGDEPGVLALAFQAIEVEGGLSMPTELRFLPGGEELLIAEKDGLIVHLRLEGERARRLGELDVPGVYSDLDCGLVSFALDPDFAANGYLYAGLCDSLTHSSIVRLTFRPGDPAATTASAVEILRTGDPAAARPWHNIGSIGFDSSGAMWALFGDKWVKENGQDLDDQLGAVVRIIPSREEGVGGHTPAPDNPFIGMAGRHPDVYATGLRSPWRGALDGAGRLWIGDVGSSRVEEINVLKAPGENFGWATHEGPCETSCARMRDPVTWWRHEDATSDYLKDDRERLDTSRRVAWVGVEQRPPAGREDPYGGALAGRMIFGDFCVGFVRAMTLDDQEQPVVDQHLGHLAYPSSWDQAGDGSLIATTFGLCETDRPNGPPPGGLWRAVLAR